MTSDLINGAWELAGALFALHSIYLVVTEKAVKGVSWASTLFFALWGGWNVIFYPMHGLLWSALGGVVLFATNVVYVSLLIYYRYYYDKQRSKNISN